MPELPEVETVARGLNACLPGQAIQAVEMIWPGAIAAPAPDAFAARLAGRRFMHVARRGKFLDLHLDADLRLFAHLRMSGALCVTPAEAPLSPYARVILHLTRGYDLRFVDTRKFGRLYLTDDPAAIIGELGPEPLGEEFTPAWLLAAVKRRRTRLKPLLLDQRFIAGLGNIYADEALFEAGLHPLRVADTLNAEEAGRLHAAVQSVLQSAIERRGTTLRAYRDAAGEPGGNQPFLRAYGQTGRPCARCGRPIERIVVGQRSTHFCSHCQR